MYKYYQQTGGQEEWKTLPVKQVDSIVGAMFITVLATDKIVTKDMDREANSKVKYSGPLYFDIDAPKIEDAIASFKKLLAKLTALGVDLHQVKLYATGKKGFHCEIPQEMLSERPKPTQHLPIIYKEMAFKLAVDYLDFVVYSLKRGRMWRQPDVKRENGKYKVQLSPSEIESLTPQTYDKFCSAPRGAIELQPPTLAVDLLVMFDTCSQKVAQMLSKRGKAKRTRLSSGISLPSVDLLLQNKGIKSSAGFQSIALQLAIYANERGWAADELIRQAEGLIEEHSGDGSRYDTPAKRAEELRRMYDYTNDNPCYEFSAQAIKSLLSHPAPDLAGMPIEQREVEDLIEAGAQADSEIVEEEQYNDLAGVVINKFGIYATGGEFGSKRVSAISFENVRTLRSTDAGTISMIEADVLVNGKLITRSPIELETFHSAANFNRFAARLGHAFQGNDANVRGMYLRIMEKSKATGSDNYACSREGLDVINIPNHEDERLRKPFMVWADGKGVVLEPRVADTGVNISFQGYPDPRGQFRCDLGDAPILATWIEEDDNKELLASVIESMLTCHTPNVAATTVGWYVSCFYRMLFHKAYGQYPLLHINGSAGSGKTSYTRALLSFFFCNQEAKILTPTSTAFAITYCASGSASIPLVIDEYKPHEMPPAMHDKLKGMLRDAYNCRDVQRGGGTRDSDDYRVLSSTMLAAPMAFIAEAMEEESALMERVVLVTMPRPTPLEASRNLMKFIKFSRHKTVLSIVGKYIAAGVVGDYSIEKLRLEFDAMMEVAQDKFLLQEGDIEKLSPEKLREKFSNKYRPVFNFTVAKFGIEKLGSLLRDIYGSRFDPLMERLGNSIYDRMADLNSSTQAEWLKVLNTLVDLSYADPNSPYALIKSREYELIKHGGIDCVELSLRACYAKYRQYCRANMAKPLFAGEAPFLHGIRDASALVAMGYTNGKLRVPGGSVVFSADQLAHLGVRAFKP